MTRIDQIRDKIAASLDAAGKPKPGYSLRVAACRRELSRLELEQATPMVINKDSAGVDTLPDAP